MDSWNEVTKNYQTYTKFNVASDLFHTSPVPPPFHTDRPVTSICHNYIIYIILDPQNDQNVSSTWLNHRNHSE